MNQVDRSAFNSEYCLAIDQGTTSTRAILFDKNGGTVASASRNVDIRRGPEPGHVEQDANQIAASVEEVIREAVEQCAAPERIQVAGLATQRSSVVAWDRRNGQPLSPVLSWQDTRCSADIDAMVTRAPEITQRSGLPLTAHYGASKIAWLLQNEHEHHQAIQRAHRDGCLAIGPLAAFVLQNIVEENKSKSANELRPAVVDHANAGRTQLMNIETGDWDPWLLEQFGVPIDVLPQIVPTEFAFGRMRLVPAQLNVVQGDQTAAIFGYGEWNEGLAHVNLGTGGFILSAAPHIARPSRLLRSVSRSYYEKGDANEPNSEEPRNSPTIEYVSEGTVNGCGAALDWAGKRLESRLGMPRSSTNAPANIDRWLAVGDANRKMFFLNTVGGLGSPYWTSERAAGWLDRDGNDVQPTRENSDAAMCAVVESILFLIRSNLDAMQAVRHGSDTQELINRIRVTGGLSQCDAYCQRLADVTQLTVARPSVIEATARGVGWLAAKSGKVSNRARRDCLAAGETKEWTPRSDERLETDLRKVS